MKTANEIASELESEYQAMINKMQASRPLVEECFSKFFDQYPDLLAFRWRQYIPNFNDGDACLFGVHFYDIEDVALRSMQSKKFAEDDELFEVSERYVRTIRHEERTEEIDAMLADIGDTISKLEPILEQLFSEGIEAVVSREDGKLLIEESEYYHD